MQPMALHRQNSEISMEFEGSEAEMMKFPRNLKVLRVSLLGGGESLFGAEEREAPIWLKYSGKRKVWAPRGPFLDPRDLCSLPARAPGPSSPGPGPLK